MVDRRIVGKQSYPAATVYFEAGHLQVTSPNIAWPLTLRTSPSDYATFKQIKYFVIYGCIWKEKKSKYFSLYAFAAEQEWILAKIGKCC